jgi:hypothetical protein
MKTCSAKKNPAVRNSRREKDARNVREEKRWLKLAGIPE